MIHLLFSGKILLLGLSIAQVLSTVRVYVSNLDYYKFLSSVQEAGYLAVPNEHVFSTLKDFDPAFCEGLGIRRMRGVLVKKNFTIVKSFLDKDACLCHS